MSQTRIEKLTQMGLVGFAVITFSLLLYRITLHADVADEIMNLSISYRIVLGDIPFYHIQEVYQTGAIFTVPFVWLFVKLTGGTTGIILYSRVVYIVVLIICAVLMYRLIRHYMRKKLAFLLSYVIVFFELYSLFYLWYDTEAVIFCLLGDLAIVKAVEQCNMDRKSFLYLVSAGVLHSCMAAVHVALIPMAVGTGIFLFAFVYLHCGKKIGDAVKCVGAYAAFPVIIVVLAGIVLLFTGNLENVWAYLLDMLNSRNVIDHNLLDTILAVKDSYMVVNTYLVNITKFLLVLYVVTWIVPKVFPFFAFAIVILPICNQYLLQEGSVRGVPNYLSYFALWAPLLYLQIRRKEKIDRCLWYIFWLPFPISAVFIPFFVVSGNGIFIKAWQMCLPAALVGLYYIIRIWKEKAGEESLKISGFLLAIVSLTLLLNSYKYVFLNEPLIEKEDIRLTEGIYAGIKVNESMECMPELERMVQKYTKDCETILVSSEIRCIYLMSDLKPLTRTTEMATNFDGMLQRWQLNLEYFKKFNMLPDIMFLEAYDLEDEEIWKLLNENYRFINVETIGNHTIYIYKEKQGTE